VRNAPVVVPNIDRTLQTGNSDGRISRQERITRRSPDSAYGIEQPAQRGEWSDRTHAGIDGAAESDGRKCEYEWFWRHDQSASKIQRRARFAPVNAFLIAGIQLSVHREIGGNDH
jgi:hypothetical protein